MANEMTIELTLKLGDAEILIAALRDQANSKDGDATTQETLDRLRIDIEEQVG